MTSTSTTDRGTRALRQANCERVTELLRTVGPQSRTALAERLGLARSAVTAIVGELIADGVVRELAEEPGPVGARPVRGRPRVLVGLEPSAARVVAIQVGARWARVVLADAAGAVVGSSRVEVVGLGPDAVVRAVADFARALAAEHDGPAVSQVGVCVPGSVDIGTGQVLRSDVLGWEDVPIAELLRAELSVPVFVQDVTQAATLAEARYGAAVGARSAIVVDHGARIGIGLVLDGRLHRGASGLAGSIGHTATFGNATPCRCGRIGCFEAVAGLRAMVPPDVARRHGPDDEPAAFREVLTRLGDGDEDVAAVVEAALDRAAHGVAAVVALIDPDVVVLTGMIIDLPAMADRLVDRTRALLSPDHRARVELRRSTLGRQAWVRGAILVALQQVQPGLQHALAGAEPISTR